MVSSSLSEQDNLLSGDNYERSHGFSQRDMVFIIGVAGGVGIVPLLSKNLDKINIFDFLGNFEKKIKNQRTVLFENARLRS